MFHSIHPQSHPAGYGWPNPVRWAHPHANMASTLSQPYDGPPPLEPISFSTEDNAEDDGESTPPPLLNDPGHASTMPNMAPIVKQHTYSAVWRATSIGPANPAPRQREQGSAVTQGTSPAAPDRRQAPASEPSTRSYVQHSQAPSNPQQVTQFNVYNNYQNYNNYNNANYYHHSQLVQMQRQMVRTTAMYRPGVHKNPPAYNPNVMNNSYYPRNRNPGESFVQQQRAVYSARVPPPVSVQQNYSIRPQHNISPVQPPVSIVQSHIQQQPQAMPSVSQQSTHASPKANSCEACRQTVAHVNTPPEQTNHSAASEMQQPNSLGAVHRVREPEEPVSKRRKESEREDRNTQVPEQLQIADSIEEDEDPNIRRYRFLLENPLVIQDLILEEKKRINAHGSNYLGIDLGIKPGEVLYQAIDFVRFHRIVQSGKVNVRLSETNVGPVVLVVHPEVINRFEQRTIDMKECAARHSLTDELLKPLVSTECFVRYALLAHREPLCWELAGILEPLDDDTESEESVVTAEDVTGISNEPAVQLTSAQRIAGAEIENEGLLARQQANRTLGVQEEKTNVQDTQTALLDDCFTCRYCDKIYTGKRSYIRHLRAHEQAKGAFQCDLCEKDFVSKSSLHQHGLLYHRSEVNQGVVVNRNKNINKQCQQCKNAGGCMCHSRNAGSNSRNLNGDIDLDPATRPVEIVTLEKLRSAFNSGFICARLSEKHTDTILVMRPEQEDSFASESVDLRLVEDVGRISTLGADLVNPQSMPDYATRCAMLVYDEKLGCWKLAGCLQPHISPGASTTEKEASDTSAPLQSEDSFDGPTSPMGVDPSSLLECLVKSSPEKTQADREGSDTPGLATAVDEAETADPLFTNPLAEQSLEDLAVNHLMTMIPQQVNHQIFDLLSTVDLPANPDKPQEPLMRGARICKICYQVFKDQKSYTYHRATHDPRIRLFKCTECDHVTTRRNLLSRHLISQHHKKSAQENNPA